MKEVSRASRYPRKGEEEGGARGRKRREEGEKRGTEQARPKHSRGPKRCHIVSVMHTRECKPRPRGPLEDRLPIFPSFSLPPSPLTNMYITAPEMS